MTHDTFIDLDDIRMHVVLGGPEDGELVVLLHGFPEFWYGFHRQIQPLVEAGYRVAAPDQRGYNKTDKPRGVAAYGLEPLGGDVVGLIEALGHERAHVVGHDWGGCVAWWVATAHPERVASLTALNMPHWAVMERALKGNLRQLQRSWYILLFQLPLLPELLASQGDFEPLAETLQEMSGPGIFGEAELARYRQAWSRPGAMNAMINWYRAALRAQPDRPLSERVQAPALILWGEDDPIFEPDLPDQSAALCDEVELVRLPGVSHFVQHAAAEAVNAHLIAFLDRHRAQAQKEAS